MLDASRREIGQQNWQEDGISVLKTKRYCTLSLKLFRFAYKELPFSLELARSSCKVSLRAWLAKFRYALCLQRTSPLTSVYISET